MTGFRLRCAEAQDVPALQRLEADAFGEKSWGAEGVAGGINAPGVRIIVAEGSQGAAIGFVFWRDLGGEAEILTIGVDPSERRRGVGRALLDAALSAAHESGARAMFLEVEAGNAAALGMYRARGFVTVGRRARYYRNGADAVILRISIPDSL